MSIIKLKKVSFLPELYPKKHFPLLHSFVQNDKFLLSAWRIPFAFTFKAVNGPLTKVLFQSSCFWIESKRASPGHVKGAYGCLYKHISEVFMQLQYTNFFTPKVVGNSRHNTSLPNSLTKPKNSRKKWDNKKLDKIKRKISIKNKSGNICCYTWRRLTQNTHANSPNTRLPKAPLFRTDSTLN